MAEDDAVARVSEALQGATSVQLYQLRALIDTMLADPKRTAGVSDRRNQATSSSA